VIAGRVRCFGTFAAVLALASVAAPLEAAPPRDAVAIPGSLSPLLPFAVDLGRLPATSEHSVVVGLELRNRDLLDAFLADVHDPASPNYGRFLTAEEFNGLFAPTEAEEAAVVAHCEANGLEVTQRFSNRLVIAVTGTAAALDRAFGVELHAVSFAGARRFAAINEPTLPPDLARVVVGVVGLDDLNEMRPHAQGVGPVPGPQAALGSSCCHLSPNDLAAFYSDTTGYDGTGQTIAIAGAYAWKDGDNTAFSTQWGLPQLPAGSGQVCTGTGGAAQGCKFSNQNSLEIALDVEYAHGTAPGARILNYMAASTSFADFTVMYNRIVTDNPGHVVSTSWGACEAGVSVATQQTDDNVFANANAIGQSWFAASGDNGSRDCSGILTVDNPANSPRVMGVGGTTPTCSSGMTSGSPGCGGYGSEAGWSGSGGGVSQVFARPAYQAGCGIPPGSQRLVPDVALESNPSPGNYVLKNGGWYIVGGTSGAAPQWAGFFAQLNQKRGGNGLGNPGTLLYGLCGTSAFHDVTSGTNGDYAAGPGFDLVTGLGSIHAQNFLALAAPGVTTTTTTSTTSTTSTTAAPTTSTSSSTSTSTAAPTTSTSTTLAPPTTSTTSSSTSTTLGPTTTSTTSSTSTSSTSTITAPAPTTTSSTSTTTAPAPTTTSTTLPSGTCDDPIRVPAEGGMVTGTTSGASAVTGCVAATGSAPERVYVWTPAVSGAATLETCGAGTTFDTVLYVRSGSCAGTQVGCNDDTTACSTGDGCATADHHGSRVALNVTAGVTYAIVVDGYSGSCGGAAGTFVLKVTPPAVVTTTTSSSTTSTTAPGPTTTSSTSTTSTSSSSTSPPGPTTTTTLPPGTCANPIVLPAAGGTVTGTTSGASALSGCVSPTGSAPEQVYAWTPTSSGTAAVATCGAGTTFDTVVYVRSGSCAGTQLACNDDTAACATGDGCATADHHGSRVAFTVTAGVTYTLVVDGYSGSCGGSSGAFSMTVTPP
jgi:pro-kumamolisin-like protein